MNTKRLALIATALVLTAPAWSADATATKPAAEPTREQVVDEFRADLQAKSADIMAKGLTLTADQAAKFWPLFETFQKEQKDVIDGQLKATQQYADHYATLSEADSLAYINALLERDAKMHDLRVKWLARFQKSVPTKIAARAIQLDRRLGQVAQVRISSQVPLIR